MAELLLVAVPLAGMIALFYAVTFAAFAVGYIAWLVRYRTDVALGVGFAVLYAAARWL